MGFKELQSIISSKIASVHKRSDYPRGAKGFKEYYDEQVQYLKGPEPYRFIGVQYSHHLGLANFHNYESTCNNARSYTLIETDNKGCPNGQNPGYYSINEEYGWKFEAKYSNSYKAWYVDRLSDLDSKQHHKIEFEHLGVRSNATSERYINIKGDNIGNGRNGLGFGTVTVGDSNAQGTEALVTIEGQTITTQLKVIVHGNSSNWLLVGRSSKGQCQKNEYIKIHDNYNCICAEAGTVTTWAPYKNFTPPEDWPDNWNQATITSTSGISKAGDRSRYYCRYKLNTTMFGQQEFDSTKEPAIGQTQQAGRQVQGSDGTLELSAEGYSSSDHFDLRIIGVHVASYDENTGEIDASDEAFDGSISVNTDPTNGVLIVNWSGASNSSWIFAVDYEFASIGEGDFGTQDNLDDAPSAGSAAMWLQTGEPGPTPCNWEAKELFPNEECS